MARVKPPAGPPKGPLYARESAGKLLVSIPGEERKMATKEEVFSKVQLALVDALGVDEDEVTPQARLVGDLGAESIDFLDIVFRLEKAFDIKIPRGELFPEDILTNTQYVQNGRVSPEGLEQLKARMPFADLTAFSKNPVVQDFGNLLTVNDMCRYVESKVAA
jgi:acyl carrier protein